MDFPRDEPGPIHKPVVAPSDVIAGVVVVSFPSVAYSEGVLTELFRPEWEGLVAAGETINHLYTIWAPRGGVRKEWYFHAHSLDRYMVLSGTLRVGLYDGREDSPTHSGFQTVDLHPASEDMPSGLRIPPGVWHSLNWLSPTGLLVNAKNPPFERAKPDKFRIPLDQLPEGIDWSV